MPLCNCSCLTQEAKAAHCFRLAVVGRELCLNKAGGRQQYLKNTVPWFAGPWICFIQLDVHRLVEHLDQLSAMWVRHTTQLPPGSNTAENPLGIENPSRLCSPIIGTLYNHYNPYMLPVDRVLTVAPHPPQKLRSSEAGTRSRPGPSVPAGC